MEGSEAMPSNVDDICRVLREIISTLDYPRRIRILNEIPTGSEKTFDDLKKATGISTGSLHHHLKEMERAGFIEKIGERPTKYKRSEFLGYLISLALEKGCPRGQWMQHISRPTEAGEGSN